jgi:manganese transport protein
VPESQQPPPSEPPPRRSSSLSLSDVHGSVAVPSHAPHWRRWLAVSGPALMVAVGYMDPGNWATDIAGGSRYEYRLLWVLLMSNLMAVLLQSMAARLGIVRRRDLAQASREQYPRLVNLPLYALAEIAIAATDLAEVIGSAIALQLLFGLPLLVGVVLTTLDVLLLLLLTHHGIRKLEAVVLALVGTMGVAFLIEIVLARPDWGTMGGGFVPSLPDSGALYIAIGILGATVMPHNLYLHSALVQTRRFADEPGEMRRSIRINTIDSAVSLNLAFFVNAAILVMAAAVFYRAGLHDVAEIQDAHRLLEPLLGAAIAPIAFAVALLASGQSSTLTGTLAGQVVMEGYLDLRIRPWLRRVITRLLAVVPAVLVLVHFGERSSGDLLVLSQVILSLQLPFATIPLIHFVSDRSKMGEFAIGRLTQVIGWLVAAVIVGLNAMLTVQVATDWLAATGAGGVLIRAAVVLGGATVAALLLWVTFHPWAEQWLGRRGRRSRADIHRGSGAEALTLESPSELERVAIALDFSGREERLLSETLRVLGGARPRLGLFHIVESPSARAFGLEAADSEVRRDAARLESAAAALRELGYEVETRLGAGDPPRELARLVDRFDADLVVLGGHGHRGVSDLVYGTTAAGLRHRTQASMLIIPLGEAAEP